MRPIGFTPAPPSQNSIGFKGLSKPAPRFGQDSQQPEKPDQESQNGITRQPVRSRRQVLLSTLGLMGLGILSGYKLLESEFSSPDEPPPPPPPLFSEDPKLEADYTTQLEAVNQAGATEEQQKLLDEMRPILEKVYVPETGLTGADIMKRVLLVYHVGGENVRDNIVDGDETVSIDNRMLRGTFLPQERGGVMEALQAFDGVNDNGFIHGPHVTWIVDEAGFRMDLDRVAMIDELLFPAQGSKANELNGLLTSLQSEILHYPLAQGSDATYLDLLQVIRDLDEDAQEQAIGEAYDAQAEAYEKQGESFQQALDAYESSSYAIPRLLSEHFPDVEFDNVLLAMQGLRGAGLLMPESEGYSTSSSKIYEEVTLTPDGEARLAEALKG